MRAGRSKEIIEIMPEFTEQAIAETDGGALTWLIAALDFPTEPAILHGYGTVIGTGNAIVEWPISTETIDELRGTHPRSHRRTLTPCSHRIGTPGGVVFVMHMSKPERRSAARCGSDHPLFHPLAVDHRPPDPSRPQPSMEPRRSGLPCPWDDRLRSEDRC